MEFSPSGRSYLRWPAYSDADSSWTSSLVSASRFSLPRSSRARTCSSGSSDLFVCKGVPDHREQPFQSEFSALFGRGHEDRLKPRLPRVRPQNMGGLSGCHGAQLWKLGRLFRLLWLTGPPAIRRGTGDRLGVPKRHQKSSHSKPARPFLAVYCFEK